MILHNCEQNSPEWYEARRGLVTASEFSTILAQGRGSDASGKRNESVTRARYLRRLAGERMTGEVEEGYTNDDIRRGHEMEAAARSAYQIERAVAIERVGFVTDDRRTVGASPDSFVANRSGGLEIKTAKPSVLFEHIDRALKDPLYFPAEHAPQCQGNIWVCEFEWWDLAIYWPKCPLFIRRLYRNEGRIREIAEAVEQANEEVERIVQRIGAYAPEAA